MDSVCNGPYPDLTRVHRKGSVVGSKIVQRSEATFRANPLLSFALSWRALALTVPGNIASESFCSVGYQAAAHLEDYAWVRKRHADSVLTLPIWTWTVSSFVPSEVSGLRTQLERDEMRQCTGNFIRGTRTRVDALPIMPRGDAVFGRLRTLCCLF